MEQSSTSPATNNAIRGAEQSGNIAKKRFARKGGKVRGSWQSGKALRTSDRKRSIEIERSN